MELIFYFIYEKSVQRSVEDDDSINDRIEQLIEFAIAQRKAYKRTVI